MPIDPNEAPEGYIAVPLISCDKCALNGTGQCMRAPCLAIQRSDGEPVMFALKPDARARIHEALVRAGLI